jgi:type IX secretion system PorP/SprF family membrane protein
MLFCKIQRLLSKQLFAVAVTLCSIIGFKCYAQDPHFSQFFEAPLLRNPSLAGIFAGDIRFQAVYRNQWQSVTNPYQTGSINFEYKNPVGRGNDFLTTGIQILYDRAGITNFTTSNIYPAINFHKSLSDEKTEYLSFGVMGGYVQRRIDRSKITTNNQFDGFGYNPSLSDGETLTKFSYAYWDGSAGVSFNASMGENQSNYYFVGLAYHHFNRPKNSFYQNPPVELSPKVVASGGIHLSVNDYSTVTLQGDYSNQGNYNEIIAGATYGRKIGDDYEHPDYTIQFGGYIRWQDAFIPVIELDYNPFAVAFSYDVNISALKTASESRGGFELSVTYAGFLDRNNSTKNALLCPKF